MLTVTDNRPVRMASCHPDKIHWARDMCRNCYSIFFRNNMETPKQRAHRLKSMSSLHKKYVADGSKRISTIKSKYGLSEKEYREILAKQDGKCAICRRPKPRYKHLAVDHDHKTGKIRGLLCSLCNPALGAFDDSIETLTSAIEYLRGREDDDG